MKKIFILSSLIVTTLATPAFATPTEADKRTVASKAYVDTKQDIIPTGLAQFDDYGTTATVPALVITNATGTALNGNTIGFLDLNTYNNLDSGLDELPDTMVPSIGLMKSELGSLENNLNVFLASIADLSWNAGTFPAAINAYSTTFDPTEQHVNGNWPYNQQRRLVRADTFANSLALKQNKIAAGTAGNVVTYTGTAGTVGSVAVSSTEDYNQQNELTNGSNLANVQLVSTKQNKMTCAGWDSETHTDEHCWLWSIE